MPILGGKKTKETAVQADATAPSIPDWLDSLAQRRGRLPRGFSVSHLEFGASKRGTSSPALEKLGLDELIHASVLEAADLKANHVEPGVMTGMLADTMSKIEDKFQNGTYDAAATVLISQYLDEMRNLALIQSDRNAIIAERIADIKEANGKAQNEVYAARKAREDAIRAQYAEPTRRRAEKERRKAERDARRSQEKQSRRQVKEEKARRRDENAREKARLKASRSDSRREQKLILKREKTEEARRRAEAQKAGRAKHEKPRVADPGLANSELPSATDTAKSSSDVTGFTPVEFKPALAERESTPVEIDSASTASGFLPADPGPAATASEFAPDVSENLTSSSQQSQKTQSQ